MASMEDRKTQELAPPIDGEESSTTQFLGDLDDQLISLEDKKKLCDTVLRDLEELRDLLVDKTLRDDPFPA